MKDLKEFERYMAHLSEGLGHTDRHAGLRGYSRGLHRPDVAAHAQKRGAHGRALGAGFHAFATSIAAPFRG